MNEQSENSADKILCPCSGTKLSQIQSLYEQGFDVDAISRITGALSGCGGCEWDIGQFLDTLPSSKKISRCT